MLIYIPVAYLAERTSSKLCVAITFGFFTLFPLVLLFSQSMPMLIVAFIIRGLKEFGEPTRKALIVKLAPEGGKASAFGAYYLVLDIVVSIAALSSALLWDIHSFRKRREQLACRHIKKAFAIQYTRYGSNYQILAQLTTRGIEDIIKKQIYRMTGRGEPAPNSGAEGAKRKNSQASGPCRDETLESLFIGADGAIPFCWGKNLSGTKTEAQPCILRLRLFLCWRDSSWCFVPRFMTPI